MNKRISPGLCQLHGRRGDQLHPHGAFTAVTVLSSFTGTRMARRVSARSLRRGFAWFLVVVATYILLKSVFPAA